MKLRQQQQKNFYRKWNKYTAKHNSAVYYGRDRNTLTIFHRYYLHKIGSHAWNQFQYTLSSGESFLVGFSSLYLTGKFQQANE